MARRRPLRRKPVMQMDRTLIAWLNYASNKENFWTQYTGWVVDFKVRITSIGDFLKNMVGTPQPPSNHAYYTHSFTPNPTRKNSP